MGALGNLTQEKAYVNEDATNVHAGPGETDLGVAREIVQTLPEAKEVLRLARDNADLTATQYEILVNALRRSEQAAGRLMLRRS